LRGSGGGSFWASTKTSSSESRAREISAKSEKLCDRLCLTGRSRYPVEGEGCEYESPIGNAWPSLGGGGGGGGPESPEPFFFLRRKLENSPLPPFGGGDGGFEAVSRIDVKDLRTMSCSTGLDGGLV